MDGGCIGILRKNELSHAEKGRFERYRSVAKLVIPYFSIRVKKPVFEDLFEREQLITVFGHLPKTEFTICGFADAIFAGAEDMLRMFGGYLYLGLDQEVARQYMDHTIPIIHNLFDEDKDTDHTYIYARYLSDVVLVSQYFNSGGGSLCEKIGFKM